MNMVLKQQPVSGRMSCLVLMVLVWVWSGAETGAGGLPHGSAPAPIVPDCFPDRLHAFVFRNWQVVEPERMARVLGTSVTQVRDLAKSMGLPEAAPIAADVVRRAYITILRRNWHLLPYDQLLELVGMSEAELGLALMEDDFLWIKFGQLKPRCERLRYEEPGPAARRRAGEIANLLRDQLGETMAHPMEPRFAFVERLSAVPPEARALVSTNAGESLFQLRYVYSYFGLYGDPLLNPNLDPYPDGLLARLRAVGVDGIWLHVVLRHLAPGTGPFGEFGSGHEMRLANLQALARRAARHGIGVYLYLNEPRAMPVSFFESRPELGGVREGELRGFCTSQPAVRDWLAGSLKHVFARVPELAGVFTITASENLTHCASHGGQAGCPRCRERDYAGIIAEVNAAIAQGVHAAQPKARVLAWDWGWHGHGDAADVIAKLPADVWLLSVSEWGLPIERGGIRSAVGEYSISAVGPGPRARRHWALARERGLSTAAKVQLNSTWELSTLPYLPVLDLVAEHCQGLAAAGVDGIMLSWTLGGYPSPNLEVAHRFSRRPVPTTAAVLDDLARERFGPAGWAHARKAWTAFSRAFQEYPYDGAVVYNAPVQIGPANPLYLTRTGYGATMTGFPYDDLAGWRGPYPPEVFAGQFEKLAEQWAHGLPDLERAVSAAPAARREEAQAELRYARAAGLHFQSVANQVRFVLHRDRWAAGKDAQASEGAALREIAKREMALARELFGLAWADSRVGFEAANQYVYLPVDLAEKIVNCDYIMQRPLTADH